MEYVSPAIESLHDAQMIKVMGTQEGIMIKNELTSRDKMEHHIRNRLVSMRYRLEKVNLPKKGVLISLLLIERGLKKLSILG